MKNITLQAVVSTWWLEDWAARGRESSGDRSYRLVCHAEQLTVRLVMGMRELQLLATTLEGALDSSYGVARGASRPPMASLRPARVDQASSYALNMVLTCRSFHASPPLQRRERSTGWWELGVDDGQGTHVFLVLSAPDVGALLAEVHALLAGRPRGHRLPPDQAVRYLNPIEQMPREGEQPAGATAAGPQPDYDEESSPTTGIALHLVALPERADATDICVEGAKEQRQERGRLRRRACS